MDIIKIEKALSADNLKDFLSFISHECEEKKAKKLGYNPEYFYKMIRGDRRIPYNFYKRVVNLYNLSDPLKQKLDDLIRKDKIKIKTEHLTDAQKETVALFKTKIMYLNRIECEKIIKILKKEY